MFFVGTHDHLHKLVSHNIFFGEINKLDGVYVFEHDLGFLDAALLPAWKVDLRSVAGNDDLGTKADTREEHLHLLARRVLGFVENDECIRQRAAAHECKRSDLDDAFLEHLGHFLGIDEIEQRVIKRTKIRIDLFLQIARQKSEPLTSLDRRPRQDNAADLLLEQGIESHRNRQITLSRARDADAEDEIVLGDRLKILSLIRSLRCDRLFA